MLVKVRVCVVGVEVLVMGNTTKIAFGRSISLVYMVNAPVATSSWYPTPNCGSSKLVLPSGYTPSNRHDRRAKPGEVSGVVCVFTFVTAAPFLLLFHLSRPPCHPSTLLIILLPLLSGFSPLSPPLLYSYFFPFSLSPHHSLPHHGRKSPTAWATCNHVGGPGESVFLSLTQIVTRSGVR
ncbi:unnamed protein product [Schistocephalus solidus]|uniref:Secreted protein n=1 Tax=Schistocephalus solidus TaxID=70667 RepID=A0A183TFE7_SCHSO|nr:unnamed protein product [Schistocephalus solidus]